MNILSNEVYQMWKTNRESSNVADLEFCPQSTIDRIPKRWESSSLLKNSTLSWAKALKEIYVHEMSFPSSISPSTGRTLLACII